MISITDESDSYETKHARNVRGVSFCGTTTDGSTYRDHESGVKDERVSLPLLAVNAFSGPEIHPSSPFRPSSLSSSLRSWTRASVAQPQAIRNSQ